MLKRKEVENMMLEEYLKLNYKPRKPKLMEANMICNDMGSPTIHEDTKKLVVVSRVKAMCACNNSMTIGKKVPKFVLEESFAHLLIKHMNDKGLEAPDVYKACNMTKFNFSHQLDPKHKPSKKSVLALCIGLKLDLEEANHFLTRAGYTFSPANRRDMIVRYYITESIYDIDTINSALYDYEEDTIP